LKQPSGRGVAGFAKSTKSTEDCVKRDKNTFQKRMLESQRKRKAEDKRTRRRERKAGGPAESPESESQTPESDLTTPKGLSP
jgi:hypothetical protein